MSSRSDQNTNGDSDKDKKQDEPETPQDKDTEKVETPPAAEKKDENSKPDGDDKPASPFKTPPRPGTSSTSRSTARQTSSRFGGTSRTASRPQRIKVPIDGFEQIAGYTDTVREFKEIAQFIRSPESFDYLETEAPRTILLYGPPGTGKTLMARALADSVDAKIDIRKGSDFLRKYMGEATRLIEDIFKNARKPGMTVVFFDEVDAIASRRADMGASSSAEGEREGTLMGLLTELDGFKKEKRPQFIFIAATNRAHTLDSAFLSRMNRQIYVPLPDLDTRQQILKLIGQQQNIHWTNDQIAEVARETEGLSGRQIESLLKDAGRQRYRRLVNELESLVLENRPTDANTDENTFRVFLADGETVSNPVRLGGYAEPKSVIAIATGAHTVNEAMTKDIVRVTRTVDTSTVEEDSQQDDAETDTETETSDDTTANGEQPDPDGKLKPLDLTQRTTRVIFAHADENGYWTSLIGLKPGKAKITVCEPKTDRYGYVTGIRKGYEQSFVVEISKQVQPTTQADVQAALKQIPQVIPDAHDIPAIADALDSALVGHQTVKAKLANAAGMHYTYLRENPGQDVAFVHETNILLVGPDGVGKEKLAEALARHLDVPFAMLDASRLNVWASNNMTQVQYTMRKLYLDARRDREKAEVGIVYVTNIDKIALSQATDRDDAIRFQREMVRLVEGEQVEFYDTPDGGQSGLKRMYSGNILYIFTGEFMGIQDHIERRMSGQIDGKAITDITFRLSAEDLMDYGFLSELADAVLIIAVMDFLTQEDITQNIKRMIEENIGRSYAPIFDKLGASVEITENGIEELAHYAYNNRIGLRGLSTIIRNTYSYVLDNISKDAEIYVINQEVVRESRSSRDLLMNPTDDENLPTLERVPDITYDDIGGLDEQIKRIKEIIESRYVAPHINQMLGIEPAKGLLLYGPPGTGKTMIAKAIANSLLKLVRDMQENIHEALILLEMLQAQEETLESRVDAFTTWQAKHKTLLSEDDAPPADSALTNALMTEKVVTFLEHYDINPANTRAELALVRQRLRQQTRPNFMIVRNDDIKGGIVGETEKKIRDIFNRARQAASPMTPVVMFFDEIDGLFRKRGATYGDIGTELVVPAVLAQIDGVDGLSDVIIIGATNREKSLDQAITREGRLSEKIEIPRPNREGVQQILEKLLSPPPELPFALDEMTENGNDPERHINALCQRLLDLMYHPEAKIWVSGHRDYGPPEDFPWSRFINGALLAGIINEAKKITRRRAEETGEVSLRWQDLHSATITRIKQNAIFFAEEIINVFPEDRERVLARLKAEIDIPSDYTPVTEESTSFDNWFATGDSPWNRQLYRMIKGKRPKG